MYLKRIEMKGFKSFANQTVLEFNQGLNAVVGPNGSGKSNIIEAVRWVLGEQSAKQLRGDKMQDIIFQGTHHRRGMNHASVTIVIDNKERVLPYDSDEITITRRLNRQNESEFELNQRQCRLKDITDLFTDSGVGRQSLAIISQGKIEAIFDHKPENRRQLFEEAAGVLKYKQRKQQTEKKLTETDEHMDRVDDVLYELEVQLEPLQEQAKVAKRHQALTESLKILEISSIGAYLTKQKDAQKELTKQVQQLAEERHQLKKESQRDEATLNDYRLQLSQLEEAQETKQKDYVALTRQLSEQQSKVTLWQERERHHEESEQQLQQQLFALDADLMKIVSQKAELASVMRDHNHHIQEAKEKVKQLEKEKKWLQQAQEQSLDEIRDDYFQCLQAQADLKNKWQETKGKYERYHMAQQRLQQQKEELEAQKTALDKEERDLKQRQNETDRDVSEAEKALATAKAARHYQQNKKAEKEKQGREALRQLEHWRAKVASEQQLMESRAHFFEGTRAVLNNKELDGIVGAVAECIEMDSAYTTAIDVALGNSGQHIIVKKEKQALRAIQFLKDHQAGQATFLARDVIKAQSLDPVWKKALANMDGFIGIASELVKTDEKNRDIMVFLLGKIVIANTMEQATKMAKAIQYKAKIVTLEGDVVQPGGALTGGSRRKQSSLLKEKEKLQRHEAKFKEFEALYAQFTKRMTRLEDEEATLKVDEEKAQAVLQEAIIQQKQSRKLWDAYQQERHRYDKEAKLFETEWQNATEVADFTKQEAEFHHQLQVLTDRQTQLKGLMEQAQIGEKERQQKEQALQEALYQAKTKVSIVQTKGEQQQNERRHLEEEEEKITARKKALQAQLAVLQGKQEAMDIVALKQEVAALKDEVTQKEHALDELKVKREELATKREHLEVKWQDETEACHRHDVALQKHQQQLEQVEMGLDDALRYLSTEYQLTYERAIQDYPVAEPMDNVAEKIAALKKERKALGPINMEAMTQFEEVNERYQFMTSQREDLEQAKHQLLETMGEMDQEVKRRFKETFSAISTAFSDLFPKMFGGGHAWLSLTNPDDLLTTGIDIEVQPPGKKVKAMSLLSGGERSLTAITLLFAVIQVRPVPFCILDEVEAALDEANVQRFSHYLKHFHNRQFIVITHRKGTMEMADALYGITMEEEGVSEVVAVKLEEQHD